MIPSTHRLLTLAAAGLGACALLVACSPEGDDALEDEATSGVAAAPSPEAAAQSRDDLDALGGDDGVAAAGLSPDARSRYVRTPGGLVHSSCVYSLRPGARLEDDDVIEPDGSRRHLPTCPFPRFSAPSAQTAARPEGASAPAPFGNGGWIASSSVTASAGAAHMASNLTVPDAPPTNHNQLLYLFSGLDPAATDDYIVQPVLQWGVSPIGGGAHWAFANWIVGKFGTMASHLDATSAGRVLRGTMNGSGCAGGGCTDWVLAMTDTTSGTTSTLRHTIGHIETLNWLFGGVLEVYGVTTCSDLPGSAALFESIHVRDQDNALMSPSWSTSVHSGAPCGLHMFQSSDQTHIHYNGV